MLTSGKVLAFQKKKKTVRQHVFGSNKVIARAASEFALIARWLIRALRMKYYFHTKAVGRFVLRVDLAPVPLATIYIDKHRTLEQLAEILFKPQTFLL